MKSSTLLALTTAGVLAACTADKPAASADVPKDTTPASTPAVATTPATTPPVATESKVAPSKTAASAARASAPAKGAAPSAAAPQPAPANAPAAAAAPVVTKPAAAPTPAAAAPAPQVAANAAPKPLDPRGQQLYEENCRKCHGLRGIAPKMMKTKFPKLVTFDEAFFDKVSDDSVVKVLTRGIDADMVSFKDKLSRDEMGAVAGYIRTFAKKP